MAVAIPGPFSEATPVHQICSWATARHSSSVETIEVVSILNFCINIFLTTLSLNQLATTDDPAQIPA